MADSFLTIGMVTRELMFQLENALTFTKYVNRNYDDYYGRTGAKIGDTLTIRLPPLFTVRSGRVASLQDLTEQSVNLQLNQQKGVDLDFNSDDLLLSLDDFSNRFLKSAAATIANEIDKDGLALYKDVFNHATISGTPALSDVLSAGVKLDRGAVPRDGLRSLVVGPQEQADFVDALKGLFHSSEEIERQYEQGNMGLAAGFMWSMDQNINTHTVGVATGTPLVNGASQTGSSLATDGWTNDTTGILLDGDIITLAGVNSVNPRSKQDNGVLQQFVVTADANSGATTGPATLSISPAITTSGAYQTVTASPADDAAITVLGTGGASYGQSVAFHRDAFVLGMADLPLPMGTHQAARISDEQLGISIRMIWDYDSVNDKFICRTDVLYGWVTARGGLASRLSTAS